MRYWEKTVEYKFVCELCNHSAAKGMTLRLAPLDGKHEKYAGDAIFSANDLFWLIEFKRDAGSIDDEYRKFDIGAILDDPILCDGNQHHVIIYGSTERGDRLTLRAIRYIKAFQSKSRNGEEILSLYRAMVDSRHNMRIDEFKPCNLQNFKEYIEALGQYRLGGSDASGSSGGVAPNFLECAVLCLDNQNNITALSLGEFMQAVGLEHDVEPEPPEPSTGPSPSPRGP